MQKRPQKQGHEAHKTQSFISRSVPHSSYQNKRSKQKTKTIYTEISLSQPKLENKKLKYCRPSINSSFFNHLSSTKIIQPKQLLDQSFVKFLDHVQKYKGFKGTKTHSWNQLMYLTPQKRHKDSSQELTQIKKQLYQILKPQQSSANAKTPNCSELLPMRTTLVQFLTEYNPKNETIASDLKKTQINAYKWHKKPGNVIRQKLRKYQRKSEYKSKMCSYEMLFQGYKIP